MDSGVLPVGQTGTEVKLRSIGQGTLRAARRPVPAGHGGDYAPPESPAVVVAGLPTRARSAVLGELVGDPAPRGTCGAEPGTVLDVPDETYLVLRHGMRRTARAFLPGSKQAHQYPAENLPPRPPRRVELTLPATVLTSFAVVDTPRAGAFGPAYNRIVLDTADRAGALLVTLDAQVLPGQAELDFLVAAAERAAALFFAIWADGADESTTTKMAAYRDVVASRVPRFAEAPWFLVVPGSGAADLRQALADWAGAAVAGPELPAQVGRRRVPTAVDGRESGWQDLLDRMVQAAEHSVRQRLSVELASIHVRCVQEIVLGGGCAGMPPALDRELHALSLRGADEVHAAVTEMTRQVLAHVLAEAPYDDVLRRVADALRRRIAEDGPDLDRILLVTSTGGVAEVAASAGLSAYQTGRPVGVLPPLAIGLSASCYQKWAAAEPEKARAWLQDAVRATELELQRVLAQRFEAVQQVLSGLVGDAVDHGLLLV